MATITLLLPCLVSQWNVFAKKKITNQTENKKNHALNGLQIERTGYSPLSFILFMMALCSNVGACLCNCGLFKRPRCIFSTCYTSHIVMLCSRFWLIECSVILIYHISITCMCLVRFAILIWFFFQTFFGPKDFTI